MNGLEAIKRHEYKEKEGRGSFLSSSSASFLSLLWPLFDVSSSLQGTCLPWPSSCFGSSYESRASSCLRRKKDLQSQSRDQSKDPQEYGHHQTGQEGSVMGKKTRIKLIQNRFLMMPSNGDTGSLYLNHSILWTIDFVDIHLGINGNKTTKGFIISTSCLYVDHSSKICHMAVQ